MTTIEKIEQIDKWLDEYEANNIYDLIEKVINTRKRVAVNMYCDLIACWRNTCRDHQGEELSNQELDSLILDNVSHKLNFWAKELGI